MCIRKKKKFNTNIKALIHSFKLLNDQIVCLIFFVNFSFSTIKNEFNTIEKKKTTTTTKLTILIWVDKENTKYILIIA